MTSLRMTSDLRRELILGAAKRCFARYGFAGTTTRSVAAAAKVSEALLFKHFPTKSALYGAILAEACEADPALHRLLDRPPSTETLVVLVRGMAAHFMRLPEGPDAQEAHKLRLLILSQLDDGDFARILYEKIGGLIGPIFTESLNRAVASGDAATSGDTPLNLFWFAYHTILMTALARLPMRPCLVACGPEFERDLCRFILRGIGLTDAAIATYLDRELPPGLFEPTISDAQLSESA